MTDLVQPMPEAASAGHASAAQKGPREYPVMRRLAALAVLLALMGALGWLVYSAWRAVQDGFVAPLMLSPESAPVLQNKLRLTELELEKARSLAEAETASADAADAAAEHTELVALRETVTAGQPWTQTMQHLEARTGMAAIDNVTRREGVLTRMLAKQQRFVEVSKQNLGAGLINRAEYEREEQRLDELMLSALEAKRSRIDSELELRKVRLGQRSVAGAQGVPLMPEMVSREDLVTRIDVQLLHAEARKRTKLAERRALDYRVEKLDELMTQLRSVPLYQATETSLDVAFVPYTQLAAVHAGAEVLQCTFVIFRCRVVGRVSSLVAGEVVQPDPWGQSERGQYALLELSDRAALYAKTLRVRRVEDAK